MISDFPHLPVLLTESIEALQPKPGGRYIDATLGLGGHAEKVLALSSPSGQLLGIDADPSAIETAAGRLARFGSRFHPAQTYYDHLESVARERGFFPADGVLFDLGVSSPQFDQSERGFSFREDGPLDMRFGPGASASAADLIATLTQDELARMFREYGEERFSGRIARHIVEARQSSPIRSTAKLASIIANAKPNGMSERIHPATRVFQALRIAVNDELGRLARALPQALALLAAGGRLAVISFHSLEDRIVKQFMQRESRDCICPPQIPVCICEHRATLRIVTRKPLTALPAELAINARSRSAKLRVAERLT